MKNIKIVTIIGANGTMGTNAAAMFSSFGNAKVYLISRSIQKSRNSIDRAVKSVRADSIRKNMIACDYTMLETCIKESDLIFESVSEDIEIKKEVTLKAIKYANENSIIATGTSGLSINSIAKELPENLRKNYYGVHFFNPPYNMTLLELIPSIFAEEATTNEFYDYLKRKLFRTVVICKDSPAFVANRIGFQFLNMALQYAEKYKDRGGINYIESILGTFTGRNMTPCETVDFVGLDVHKAIVNNLNENTSDDLNNTFLLPQYIENLIQEGKLGKKTGEGLFKSVVLEDGTKEKMVFDIKTNKYIKYKKLHFVFADRMNSYLNNGDYALAFNILLNDKSNEAKICLDFLKTYIEYSLYVGKEVCRDIKMIDDAMATGFNWCPPLALSNALFKTNYDTKYDYRSYFKVVK